MTRIIIPLLLVLFFTNTSAQTRRTTSTYLSIQYDKTMYDATIGNNPSGIGLGIHSFLKSTSTLKPLIEVTADIYLEDDKTLRIGDDHQAIEDLRAMVNLLGGFAYAPSTTTYISFLAGPGFINGKTYLAVKPSVGIYFSRKKRLTATVSFLNIFNRYQLAKQDFGSVVFSIGCKLF